MVFGERFYLESTSPSRVLQPVTDLSRDPIASVQRGGGISWGDSISDIPAAIAVFDRQMRYVGVSRRFLADFELEDPSQVIGRSIYEIFPEMPLRWGEISGRVLAGERPASESDLFPLQDGRIKCVRWSMNPLRAADGQIVGALLFVEVITDKAAATRAIGDDAKTPFHEFENTPFGLAHHAPDGRFLRANEMVSRILGYSAEELTTKSYRDVTAPDDIEAGVACFEMAREGKFDRCDSERHLLRADGTMLWARVVVSPVRRSDRSVDHILVLVEDISERKQREEELRNSEEQFRSLVLASPLPIILYDDREEILAISESWLEQTGYSREELRRLEDWTTRAYQERSGEVLKYLRGITSGEPPQGKLCDECTIRAKDGHELLWRCFRAVVRAQSDGRRLFITMAYDVNDPSKAYASQILFLMRESNHRAKNMLSLVQAIARQTAVDQPEFIQRFNERIRALAASHDLLIRNAWKGADIDELMRVELAHFADLFGSRIVTCGPQLRLNNIGAQTIGLALYELSTNASKYGALSTDAGRVDVRWRLESDAFMISWTERNGPPVSPPKRRGFGSTVVESMGKQSLGGEVEIDYAPSGLIWRLTCPAANALESREDFHQTSSG